MGNTISRYFFVASFNYFRFHEKKNIFCHIYSKVGQDSFLNEIYHLICVCFHNNIFIIFTKTSVTRVQAKIYRVGLDLQGIFLWNFMDKRKVLENCNNSIFKTKTNSFSQINKQGSCIKNRIKNRNNFEIPTLLCN